MADFYCDISAIGNEYQAYADTPTTWGVPQDGNGKAGPGHSAAVAIATIDCTSAVGDGAQTLSILGVSVSNTSTESGATLAASLVTSINGTTTATTATYCQALLPLNRLIFARQKPDELAKVQIMLRIAGTEWNGVPTTHAGFTTGPTITDFAGGADGPFGYLITPSGVFGKSALAYGLFSLTKHPSATDITATDTIYIRTSRNASNLSVSYSAAATYTIYYQPATTTRNYVFDNGTVWSADNGQFLLSLEHTGGGSGIFLAHSGLCYTYISSLGTGRNFRIYLNGPTVVSWCHVIYAATIGSVFSLHGAELEESPTTNAVGGFMVRSVVGSQTTALTNCKVKARGARLLASFESGSGGSRFSYDGCVFEYFGLTSNVSGIFGASSYGTTSLEVTNCKFYDTNGVYEITNPVVANGTSTSCRYTFTNNQGLKNVAPGWGATAVGTSQFIVENFNTGRDFRQEEKSWLAEWVENGTFPVLSARLPNGNLWSIKVLLRTSLAWEYPGRPVKINAFYRAATDYATVGLEVLSQDALSKAMFGINVAYIDENGAAQFETTLLPKGAYSHGSSGVYDTGSSWEMNGVAGYSSSRLALTTANRVKQNTDMVVQLIVRGVFASDKTIYVNPDISLT